MSWPWWTPTKSPRGGKTNAEGESFPLRSGGSVCDIHVRRHGGGDEANRPRPPALRPLHLRLFSAGTIRAWLAHVFRPRLDPGGANPPTGCLQLLAVELTD